MIRDAEMASTNCSQRIRAHESQLSQALLGARINENMNMLIRDFYPEREPTSIKHAAGIETEVQDLLNERPRKTAQLEISFDVFENEIMKNAVKTNVLFLTKCCVRS